MMIRRSLSFALLCVLLAASPALARDAGICRSFNLEDDPLGVDLYEVTAPGRTYFVKSASSGGEDCPSTSPECQARSFLIAGDQVVVNRTSGGFACASYLNRKGSDVALWLPLQALRKSNDQPDWQGNWRNAEGNAILDIKEIKGGDIAVNGSASYNNGQSVNTGEFNVFGEAREPTLTFAYDGEKQGRIEDISSGDGTCTVRMAQLGPYIAVVDNNACGGLNVTFTGLYFRQ